MTFTTPTFVLTSDVDWAPDFCIDEVAREARARNIRPMFFATGPSDTLNRLLAEGRVDVGWHPNFRLGSTQGLSLSEILEFLRQAFPAAECWRAHGYADSSQISHAMRAAGMRFDSNLYLHLQADIQPLQHWSGLVRFPVFWEDDGHWQCGDAWDVELLLEQCLTPGLKILNVHPAAFALNIPDAAFYTSVRSQIPLLTPADVERLRHAGQGTRTFVLALLDRLTHLGHRFHTLAEVYEMYQTSHEDPGGRDETVSAADFARYSGASATERQAQLKAIYNRRNPADPYATSRDVNLRELEIAALARHLRPGRVIDLGCGNGYTLISLATARGDCRMTGVDFAEQLIAGAGELCARSSPHSELDFIHADALRYVRDLADGSVDCLITERFLLNLPGTQAQRQTIADIYRVLRPGGRFLMCEGSMEGFRGLNELRTQVGLDAIEERSADNVSAMRFEDAEIEEYCRGLGFTLRDKVGFRDYFVLSRVLHPLLVAPQPARFTARINALARQVQQGLPFAAGIGSNVLWVLDKD